MMKKLIKENNLFFNIFLIIVVCVGNVSAQTFTARTNYNAILEPNNAVLHGAGQDAVAFNTYYNLMPTDKKPIVYMTYIGLKDNIYVWLTALKKDLLTYNDTMIIPQIGLSLTSGASASYEDEVASGALDERIDEFIAALKQLAIPAYVRIGYECNGTSWNGYSAESYKSAFIRITNKIRASNLEVATVWCIAAAGGDENYMSFYPGDGYVDWWAIDLFDVADFTRTITTSFMTDAKIHLKPVCIGESTPRYVGVTNGQTSWDTWFVPYFNFIKNNEGVKMFCYINWNWANYPEWYNWGDARLEQNTIVRNNFISEISSPLYLHAGNETNIRDSFNYVYQDVPSSTNLLTKESETYPCVLTWPQIIEPSNLSHYIIYKDDLFYDYSIDTNYVVRTMHGLEQANFSIATVDRAGQISEKSNIVNVNLMQPLQILYNGDFEKDKISWALSTFEGANGGFSIETDNPISGNKSARLEILNSKNINYTLQLIQSFEAITYHDYVLRFKARASQNLTLQAFLQLSHAPYTSMVSGTFNLTTETQDFILSGTTNAEDIYNLSFMFGQNATGIIYIDDVTIEESIIMDTKEIDNNSTLDMIYLKDENSLLISNKLATTNNYKLEIYDTLGRVVFVKDNISVLNSTQIKIPALKGLHICILRGEKNVFVKKIL